MAVAPLTSLFAQAESNMNVSFVSSAWDGRTVPDRQQCNRFGGQGSTPELNVSQIPEGTTSLIMEYSGQNHMYYVTVKAMAEKMVLSEIKIEMGRN